MGVWVTTHNVGTREKGKVKMNQIKNTALGSLMFEQTIDNVFRKAVFSELRLVGVIERVFSLPKS